MKGCSERHPRNGRQANRRAGVRRVAGGLLLLVTLAACAGTQNAPQQAGAATFEGQPPSDYVEMKEVQVAYLGNAGGGDGTFTFRGQRYPFTIAGLGVGGIGVSTVDAEGEVYRLTDLEQFPGACVAGQYGAVAGTESVGDIWLENPNHVVMHLKAKREG